MDHDIWLDTICLYYFVSDIISKIKKQKKKINIEVYLHNFTFLKFSFLKISQAFRPTNVNMQCKSVVWLLVRNIVNELQGIIQILFYAN